MSKTIWKFPLKTVDEQVVEMPLGAEILSVQTQFEQPCIWAMVDPANKDVKRVFHIFGTGHHIVEADRRFIGTYQLKSGSFVFHLFEVL